MARNVFSCFPLVMADQLFLHQTPSDTGEPRWSKLDPIAIQPLWNEDVAETIQIRLERVQMITRVCRISLKPVYRQEHDFQVVSGSRCKRIFASGLERRAI